ncbi:MAG: T9SS type A sorting domain-containing protein, partial [Bacteroidales bacterium]|nr:T9SS type A sorting domain-containing protein [Bacteroidales bacterium]
RCPVFEMCENDSIDTDMDGVNDNVQPGPAGVWKFDLRNDPSVNKDGLNTVIGTLYDTLTNENLSNFIGPYGMGWFPGYAIDIETGVRLNMGFAENSWFSSENGADMLWNPTSTLYSSLWESSGGTAGYPYLGGMHYIYIFGENYIETTEAREFPLYDAGKTAFERMQPGVTNGKREVFRNAMWVAIPYLNPDFELLATDVTVKIRMANPYQLRFDGYGTLDSLNNCLPMWKIDLSNFSAVPESELTKSNVTTYPNPADDLVNILFPIEQSQETNIEIWDISGRQVSTNSFRIISKSESHYQLDISKMKKGAYFYSISTKGKRLYTDKLLIVR